MRQPRLALVIAPHFGVGFLTVHTRLPVIGVLLLVATPVAGSTAQTQSDDLLLGSSLAEWLPVPQLAEVEEPASLEASPIRLAWFANQEPLFESAARLAAETAAEDPFSESPRPNIRRALIGKCSRACAWVTAVLGAGGIAALARLDTDNSEQIGDVTQLVPAASGFIMTVLARDRWGLIEWGLAGGTTFAVTHGLKAGVDKARPNEGDKNSFPSGHTSPSVGSVRYSAMFPSSSRISALEEAAVDRALRIQWAL